MKRYSTGEVESLLGVKTSTLRYWEEEGYVAAPDRSEFGRKAYDEREIIALLRFKHLVEKKYLTPKEARNAMLAEASGQPDVKAILNEARGRLLWCLAACRSIAARMDAYRKRADR